MPSATGADQGADALAHLARRLVGEGDGQDLERAGLAGGDQVGDAGGEHAGLAGAGAGQHENRPFRGLHGGALFRVQAGQIGRSAARPRPGRGRSATGGGLMAEIVVGIGAVVRLIHRRDHGSKGERRRGRGHAPLLQQDVLSQP